MYLPGTARLALAKHNVIDNPVLGVFGGGSPIEKRRHVQAGVDAWMLQLVHEKGQGSAATSTFDAGRQALQLAARAARQSASLRRPDDTGLAVLTPVISRVGVGFLRPFVAGIGRAKVQPRREHVVARMRLAGIIRPVTGEYV